MLDAALHAMLRFLRMELKDFLRAATKRERAAIAVACNDSVPYLYQIAGHHRYASPVLAMRIEHYTRVVAWLSDGRLQPVPRETLVRHPEIFIDSGTGRTGRNRRGAHARS